MSHLTNSHNEIKLLYEISKKVNAYGMGGHFLVRSDQQSFADNFHLHLMFIENMASWAVFW